MQREGASPGRPQDAPGEPRRRPDPEAENPQPGAPQGPGLRLVGYLRVSTDRQAEQGLGLEVQERAIREWARRGGHRLAAIFRDEGISGSNGLETRVGLADALAEVGRADGLVVYRLDRLARDLVLQEKILADLRARGKRLHSVSPGEDAYLEDDPEDPSRKLIRQVLGAVASYEREIISLRLRHGRRRKSERGGFAYGAPPYGMRAVDGELAPDPVEAPVAARIREAVAAGRSLNSIARELNDEGIRPRRGERWHAVTVSRVAGRRYRESGRKRRNP